MFVAQTDYADKLTEELEQVKQYNMDKDGKKMVLPKDKVKENIGKVSRLFRYDDDESLF